MEVAQLRCSASKEMTYSNVDKTDNVGFCVLYRDHLERMKMREDSIWLHLRFRYNN